MGAGGPVTERPGPWSMVMGVGSGAARDRAEQRRGASSVSRFLSGSQSVLRRPMSNTGTSPQ